MSSEPVAQTTEVARLAARDEEMGLLRRHVSWGPAAAGVTEEERAAVINRAMDDVEAQMADTVAVPVSQMREIVAALKGLTRLGQATVEEWSAMPEGERALRHEIFRLADMPLLLASQWLPRKPKEETAHG